MIFVCLASFVVDASGKIGMLPVRGIEALLLFIVLWVVVRYFCDFCASK